MYPVLTNNNLPALNGTNGLNGWFGRMVKKLIGLAIGIVGEVPIIGGAIKTELTKVMEEVTDNNSFFQRTAPEFEPTPAEAAIIENWATTKLNPFYKALVTQLSNAFANPNFDIQLAEINNVMLKICVLKQYYAVNETTGLSADAVKSRMEVITRILIPVEELITKSISGYETVVNLTPYVFSVSPTNATQFAPLIQRLLNGQQFSCTKYVATDKPNVAPVKTPIKTTPVKAIMPGLPNVPIKTTTPANPVLPVNTTLPTNPVLPANPVVQNPATPAVTTPTTPAEIADDVESAIPSTVKSYFTIKNIGIGLLALLALRALTKKNKKK